MPHFTNKSSLLSKPYEILLMPRARFPIFSLNLETFHEQVDCTNFFHRFTSKTGK
uniref:Uncharacterized protein n=1 Tax=Rhizophora mucronata TaxID=61149 RepID=A0A2P2QCF5_RHIMU